MRGVLSATLLSLLLWGVCADMYLHYPPGCNDRNRERNENRNNDQRLFNSQNNGKGGYPWRGDATKQAAPDPLVYYPGSVLRIEWTNQHACGPNTNINCQVVIQYACNADTPGIRDGYPNSATVVESDNANAGYKRLPFTTGNGQNPDGTATIPENQFAGNRVARKQYYYTVDTSNPGVEFGMHEGVDWYDLCRLTQRNKGLYIADRNLGGNDARFTRQNNNGQRHGLECPEERDYYPYWRPYKFQVGGATPSINPTVTDTTNAILDQTLAWYDVAILTTRTDWCPYFQANSQNVRGYGQCICTTATPPGGGQSCFQRSGNLIPWDQATCQTNLGTWVVPSANGLGVGRPDCRFHDFGRDNHLGNTQPVDGGANPIINSISPEASHYDWTIPDRMAGQQCIIRTRYNISTGDYPSTNFLTRSADAINVGDLDSRYNCKSSDITNTARQGIPDPTAGVPVTQLGCKGLFNEDVVPLFNRPYIDVFGTQAPSKLSIALNTDQSGRTFQDRSYVFAVAGSNPGCGGTIYNLNFRGRRGNIVQAYPAVEYDFVPQRLSMKNGDCVHIQLHGSDFNQAQNANNGEGWQFSDRVNLVQTEGPSDNFPLAPSRMTLFPDTAQAIKWALLGQTVCQNIADNGQDGNRNQITNCGKLNSAPNRFPPNPIDGMIKMTRAGTYYYASTRNNNFSNRSMKGMIIVGDAEEGLTQAQVAGIVIGTLAGVGLLAGGILFYGKRHPNTRAGAAYSRVAGCFSRGGSTGSTYSGSTFSPSNTSGGKAPPDMEYTRH